MSATIFANDRITNTMTALNTPNCSLIGEGRDSNNQEIGSESLLFQLTSMPSFDDLMPSDSAAPRVRLLSHSATLHAARPSSSWTHPTAHSTPLKRLSSHTHNSFSVDSGILFNSECSTSRGPGAAIDLSLLCHDLGIKETETRGKTPERRGSGTSAGLGNEHRKTLSRQEMMAQIDSYKKKSRYWYSKYTKCDAVRETLERRLKRQQQESERTEFQAISKTMREWETAFIKSQKQMTLANRSIEKSFAILKDSVLQKSRPAAGSAYEGKECEHRLESELKNKTERAVASPAILKSATFPSIDGNMDPVKDMETRKRKPLPASESRKKTQLTQSFSDLQKLNPYPTAISRTADAAVRPSEGSVKVDLSPISRLSSRKDQALLSKKYMQVVKEKREALSKAKLQSEGRKTCEKMKSCTSAGHRKDTSSNSSNKKQKEGQRDGR